MRSFSYDFFFGFPWVALLITWIFSQLDGFLRSYTMSLYWSLPHGVGHRFLSHYCLSEVSEILRRSTARSTAKIRSSSASSGLLEASNSAISWLRWSHGMSGKWFMMPDPYSFMHWSAFSVSCPSAWSSIASILHSPYCLHILFTRLFSTFHLASVIYSFTAATVA